MKFEIKHRMTGGILFTAEVANTKLALELAVESGADLSGADLSGADLSGADLRGAYLRGADLRGAYLRGAYLRGADLRDACLSDAYLRDAYLRGADLRGADLSGADLRGADLSGADLRGAYLRGAYLRGADLRDACLSDAYLRDAYLRGADLRGAYLSGVPVIKNIHQAVYAAASQEGALNMATWHSCETTHCRAGWVTTLAGKGGAALEFAMSTGSAAALIYLASDPKLEKIPNWAASNSDAMADMKRLAELEAQFGEGNVS